jgi:hypothetical protein
VALADALSDGDGHQTQGGGQGGFAAGAESRSCRASAAPISIAVTPPGLQAAAEDDELAAGLWLATNQLLEAVAKQAVAA